MTCNIVATVSLLLVLNCDRERAVSMHLHASGSALQDLLHVDVCRSMRSNSPKSSIGLLIKSLSQASISGSKPGRFIINTVHWSMIRPLATNRVVGSYLE